jgi:kynurenine formamidase
VTTRSTAAPLLDAHLVLDGQSLHVDLGRPLSLARAIDFDGAALRCFGMPAARTEAFRSGAFSGQVTSGASCNCSTIHLTPHGNGTHTECVGHLTAERLDAYRVVPSRLLPAVLCTVRPIAADDSDEGTEPMAQPQDLLITRSSIQQAWPQAPFRPTALVLRTLPNRPDKHVDNPDQAPFLSREASEWMVKVGIEHLVLDVPSADRGEDAGRLTAHRIFFGLPAGSAQLAAATRAHSTITELAYIDDSARDGSYLLSLQIPAIAGDAVPSRPLLYAVLP